MQTVVSARLVMQHQRSRQFLPRCLAAFQEFLVAVGKWPAPLAQLGAPLIRNPGQVRIGSFAQPLDGGRQWVAEILIVAFSEPVALHDYLAAKVRIVTVERNQLGAFFWPQQR